MNDDKMNDILYKTLLKMARFLRTNPSDLDEAQLTKGGMDYLDYITLNAGGMLRDPEGQEFILYFMNQVVQEELLNDKKDGDV